MNLAGARSTIGSEIVYIRKNTNNRYEVAHGIITQLVFTETAVGNGKGLVDITATLGDGSTEYAIKDMSLVYTLAQEAAQITKVNNVNTKLDEADALVIALGG